MENVHGSLREKIAAEKAERAARYDGYAQLLLTATDAGMAAGKAAAVTPMVVQQHADPLNDNSELVAQYVVEDGPCGFAWVVVKDGRSSFGRYLTKEKIALKNYGGGLAIWVRHFGQSMMRKEAFAHAYAATLRAHGIDAYAASRMD